MEFIVFVSFLKSLPLFNFTSLAVFTISIICLSYIVLTIPILCLTFTAHTLIYSLQTFTTFSSSSIWSSLSDVQHFRNPLTFTSGEICCHDLDRLAHWFYAGLLVVPVVSEHSPLPGVIQNTVVSNDHWKAYSVKCRLWTCPSKYDHKVRVFIAWITHLHTVSNDLKYVWFRPLKSVTLQNCN
jgi:hypothetical protein